MWSWLRTKSNWLFCWTIITKLLSEQLNFVSRYLEFTAFISNFQNMIHVFLMDNYRYSRFSVNCSVVFIQKFSCAETFSMQRFPFIFMNVIFHCVPIYFSSVTSWNHNNEIDTNMSSYSLPIIRRLQYSLWRDEL